MNILRWALKHVFKQLSPEELKDLKNIIEKLDSKRTGYEQKTKKFWDELSEPNVLKTISSPASPSGGDIEIYREYLSASGHRKSALILGSTPSMRDLLTDLKIQDYVVADFSFLMIENNLALTKNARPDNEIWLKSEWAKMPLALNYFDCIIGDLVFSQILPKNQESFLEKISSLLAENGIFITRAHIVNTSIKNVNPKITIQSALKNLSLSDLESDFYALVYRLRDGFRDIKKQVSNPSIIIKALLEYQPKENEKELFRRLIRTFLIRSGHNLEYISQAENELEPLLKKFFVIAGKKQAGDYPDAGYFPLYLLKKKAE